MAFNVAAMPRINNQAPRYAPVAPRMGTAAPIYGRDAYGGTNGFAGLFGGTPVPAPAAVVPAAPAPSATFSQADFMAEVHTTGPDGKVYPNNTTQFATLAGAAKIAALLGADIVDTSFHNMYSQSAPCYSLKVGTAILSAGLLINECILMGTAQGLAMAKTEIQRDNVPANQMNWDYPLVLTAAQARQQASVAPAVAALPVAPVAPPPPPPPPPAPPVPAAPALQTPFGPVAARPAAVQGYQTPFGLMAAPVQPAQPAMQAYSHLFANYPAAAPVAVVRPVAAQPAAPSFSTNDLMQNPYTTGPDGTKYANNPDAFATLAGATKLAAFLGGSVVDTGGPSGMYQLAQPCYGVAVNGAVLSAGLNVRVLINLGLQNGMTFIQNQIKGDAARPASDLHPNYPVVLTADQVRQQAGGLR